MMAMGVMWMVMTRWVGTRESIGWWCLTGGGAQQVAVPEPLLMPQPMQWMATEA